MPLFPLTFSVLFHFPYITFSSLLSLCFLLYNFSSLFVAFLSSANSPFLTPLIIFFCNMLAFFSLLFLSFPVRYQTLPNFSLPFTHFLFYPFSLSSFPFFLCQLSLNSFSSPIPFSRVFILLYFPVLLPTNSPSLTCILYILRATTSLLPPSHLQASFIPHFLPFFLMSLHPLPLPSPFAP